MSQLSHNRTMDDLLCYVRFNVANNYISTEQGKTGKNSKEMAHKIHPLSFLLPSMLSSLAEGKKKGKTIEYLCIVDPCMHMLVVGSEIQL